MMLPAYNIADAFPQIVDSVLPRVRRSSHFMRLQVRR